MAEEPDFRELAAEIDSIARNARLDSLPATPASPAYIVNTWPRLVKACQTQLETNVLFRRLVLPIAIGPLMDGVEVRPAREPFGRICYGIWFRVAPASQVDLGRLAKWLGETFTFGSVRVHNSSAYLFVGLRADDLSFSRFSSMVKFVLVAGLDARAIFVQGLADVPPVKGEHFSAECIAFAADNLETIRGETGESYETSTDYYDEYYEAYAAGFSSTSNSGEDPHSSSKAPHSAPHQISLQPFAYSGMGDLDKRVISWEDIIHGREGDPKELQFGFQLYVDALSQQVPVTVSRNVLPSGEDSIYLVTPLEEAHPLEVRFAAEAAAGTALTGVVVLQGQIFAMHALEIAGLPLRTIAEQVTTFGVESVQIASRLRERLADFEGHEGLGRNHDLD